MDEYKRQWEIDMERKRGKVINTEEFSQNKK